MTPDGAMKWRPSEARQCDGMLYLNAAQDIVIFLCNAHQFLFTTVLVQRLGRRQRLLHVYSLRVRHDVRHALKQQIIGALDG